MTRILRNLSVAVAFLFATFVLLMASLQVGRSAPGVLAPAEGVSTLDGASEDPPSNEISDSPQLD